MIEQDIKLIAEHIHNFAIGQLGNDPKQHFEATTHYFNYVDIRLLQMEREYKSARLPNDWIDNIVALVRSDLQSRIRS